MSNYLLQIRKDLQRISNDHRRQADSADQALRALNGIKKRPGRHLSDAGREAIAKAQRARWAKVRKAAA